MNKDLIKSSLTNIGALNDFEKNQLNHYCNIAIKDVEKNNGKANKITIDIGTEDEYRTELIAKRIKSYKYPTSKDRLKAIGLEEANETKLIEKINKGEINNNHVTNILKADIDDALIKLPPEKQDKVIEAIVKNTNEKNLINREEIASESIKNGNINLMTTDNWYKGILRAGNNFKSKLYINEEVLKFLSEDQVQQLSELINDITMKCNEFMSSLSV